VRDMCDDAEILHKTNHSLRATGTSLTALFCCVMLCTLLVEFCTLLWFSVHFYGLVEVFHEILAM